MNEQEILPIGHIEIDVNPMIRLHGRGNGGHCGSCAHLVPFSYRSNRTYWKCDRYTMSHCSASDFRKKWNACRLYEVDA